jgi:hypothetical protein
LQANEARMVTKCRWVVESINGYLKRFKSLSDVDNKALPHLIDDFRIAASLINQFYQPLFSDGDETSQLQIARNIKNLVKTPNYLEREIRKLNLTSSSYFVQIQ